jgi:hypothetical protein
MKKVVFYLLCILLTAISIDAKAGTKSNKGYKKGGSNVYSGKKYKGHYCPPKRKIINAVYF